MTSSSAGTFTAPTTPPTPTTLPDRAAILNWHPAGYLGTDTSPYWGRTVRTFRFAPFTGTEPQPEAPEWIGAAVDLAYGGNPPGSVAPRDEELLRAVHRIYDEIDGARVWWTVCRYHNTVREALRDAMPAWEAFHAAASEAAAAFAALDDTPDTMWRSALLRMVRARDVALDAAAKFDAAAYPAANAWDEGRGGDRVLERCEHVSTIAAKAGLDVSGWDPESFDGDAYHDWSGRRSPMQEKLTRTFAEQDRHINGVARLAGDPAGS